MEKASRYDGLAARYDAFVNSTDLTTVELDSLGRLLGEGPGRCLDLGCGTGIAFATLNRLHWSIVGVDLSADQPAVAGERAEPVGAELHQADAAHLPLAADSFDAVVSLATHTDFEDAAAAFAESARVLRPGAASSMSASTPASQAPRSSAEPTSRTSSILAIGDAVGGMRRPDSATAEMASAGASA